MTSDLLAHQLCKVFEQPSMLLRADAPTFTIVAVNAALLSVTQIITEDNLVGKSLFEAFPDNPNDVNADGVSKLKLSLLNAIATGTKQEMSFQKYDISVAKSGLSETRYLSAKNTPIFNDKNQVEYIFHTTEDITDKILLEQNKEKLLSDIKNNIKYSDNLETSNAVGSWNLDLETEEFYWSPEFFEICGYVPNAFVPSLSKALEIIHPEDHEIVTETFNNAIQKGQPYRIEHRIIKANGNVAIVLAIGIVTKNKDGKHIRLTGFFQNISVQKQQNQLLNKTLEGLINSEKRYKQLFENNPSPMFVWDFKTLQIVDCNEEALLLYGYNKQEFLDLTIKDLSPQEDLFLIEDINLSEDSYHKIGKRNWRHLTKDRSLIHVFIVGHLIDYKGRKSSLVCINDVSEKIKTENALRNSELKLRTAQQVAQIGYWDFDFKTDTLTWSEELYNVFGISKQLFHETHQSFVELVDAEDRELVLATSKHTQQTGEAFTLDYKITTPSGEKRVIQEHGYGELDESGNVIRLFGTAQNITDRKLAEEKIRESNQRYEYVAKATSDAIWDWDLVNDKIYWGDGFESIFGYQLNSVKADTTFRLDHIHPDDVEAVMAGLYYVIYGSETQWEDNYRFKKADGTYAYVTNKGFVIRDSNGKALRMVGAKRDMTKQREENLRLKLLESVVTNATDMVAITDAYQIENPIGPSIIYVNPAYTKNTGYTLEEVVGKTPRILQGPKTDRKELDKLKAALLQQRPCTISVVNYKKNGEEFWTNLSVSPVKDANDTLTHWVAIKRDITKQKEEELRLQLLESVITNTSDMVIITEAEPVSGEGPKIIYVNDAFIKVTGYTKDDVIGKTPRLLQGPKTDKQEIEKLKSCLENWQPCNITVVNYKKNGDEFWNNMSISPVANANGWYTHWIAVERDVTERVQRNTDIIQAIIKTQEEERYEVGGELHDNICQILTSSKISFKMLENVLPENKLSIFNNGIETLNLAFKEIRNLSHRLAPVFLDHTTLEQAFKNTLKSFNVDEHYIIDLQFDDAFKSYHASKEFQLNLYRILQEQLNNILKYANATTIRVQGIVENHKLLLSISDDGIGFNTKNASTGIGLSNMKRRAQMFRGELIVDSEIGKGCKLTVVLPLQDLN